MAAGWNPVLVNQVLDSVLSAAAFTPPAGCFVQLHTGDPGPAGTSNISSYATRASGAWSSAAGGAKSIRGTVPITASGAGADGGPGTHISLGWAGAGGAVLGSGHRVASGAVGDGRPG